MYKIKELISPKVSVAKSIKQINILKKLLFAFSNKLITNILIVITLNKSLFKFNLLGFVVLLIGILCCIFIRLDFYFDWLSNINESLTISIRILSVVYTYYMIIILMSNWRQIINYIYSWKVTIKNNYFISFCYITYHLFISLITLYIVYINYLSILTLNIEHLDIWYLTLLVISVGMGIDLSGYLLSANSDFNFNKFITKAFKIGFFIGLITYITFILSMRYGYLFELLNKYSILNTIHLESTPDTNFQNKLRGEESHISISNVNNNRGINIIKSNNNNVNTGNETNPYTNPNNNNINVFRETTTTTSTTTTRFQEVVIPDNKTNNTNNLSMLENNNNNNNMNELPNNMNSVASSSTQVIDNIGYDINNNTPLNENMNMSYDPLIYDNKHNEDSLLIKKLYNNPLFNNLVINWW